MKKKIALALAFVIVLSQTSAFAMQKNENVIDASYTQSVSSEDESVELLAETYEYGDFKYSINEDATVTITGYNGMDTEITIPSEIDGKSVTTIGSYAFAWCESLIYVMIPTNITKIEKYAFECCSDITSFTVAENNKNYTSKDGVLFNKDMTELMYYPLGSSAKEYIIPRRYRI